MTGSKSFESFLSPEWAELLWQHGFVARPHQRLQLPVTAMAAGAVPAGVVLGHLQVMQAQPGGPWRAASNYYTPVWGVVPVGRHAVLEPAPLADWPALAAALQALPGSGVLQLDPLDAGGALLAGLAPALRQRGYLASTYFAFGNWYTPVAPGGFAAYWAQRPSALRHTVARAERRLHREHPGWHLQVTTGASGSAQLEQALADYQAVYAQSWKTPEPATRFVPELVRLAARQGWLRLGLLYLGEQPVAAQLWLVSAGTAHIYKLAYVQGHEKLSVGSVLTAHLMRHVLDVDGVHELDYGQGDDAYKRDWMTHRRERVGLIAFDLRRPRAWGPALRHWGGQWLKAGRRRFFR